MRSEPALLELKLVDIDNSRGYPASEDDAAEVRSAELSDPRGNGARRLSAAAPRGKLTWEDTYWAMAAEGEDLEYLDAAVADGLLAVAAFPAGT